VTDDLLVPLRSALSNSDPALPVDSTVPAVRIRLQSTPVHQPPAHDAWWRTAVIYQIYPRSWADSDGDGIGDLQGITARLPYLADLGVDAVWLSPFYVSPQHDAGYDVADYRDIDPLFGTLADADALIARARSLGIRVIVDLVPNHSSSEHPWFQAALAAAPGSPERARYLFRDGKGEHGELPPNNWLSVFGGDGWTRVTEADGSSGQWYLHLFDTTQPDFDWTNADVRAEFESILRFWLDRGVDGFRVDVAHGMVKAPGLPDGETRAELLTPVDRLTHSPMWDQDGVHQIYREWRRVLDSYVQPSLDGAGDDDRILCAEAWVEPPERLARYVRGDEMHQSFNFEFLGTPWLAPMFRQVIEDSLRSTDAVGAPTTWVLSNHDVVRHTSRLGLAIVAERRRLHGIGPADPQPDEQLGLRRARAAVTLMLALPGSAYLYQGEELGLPEATQLPDDVRQDPTWFRSEHHVVGRDGCRVPIPWQADAPSYGFGPSDQTWLPQPDSFRALAVDRQDGVEGSTLELYRTLLRMRRELHLGGSSLRWVDGYQDDVLAIAVSTQPSGTDDLADGDHGSLLVLVNFSDAPVPLPEGAEVLVSSVGSTGERMVPTDVAVWARL